MEVGRLAVKIAGRDAGRKCIVVDNIDDKHVLIDGDVRRRKCNVMHLEPLEQVIKIKKGASHADVAKEFKALKLATWETKPRKTAARPKKVRKVKEKPVVEEKKAPAKKQVKKEEKPKAETKLEKIADEKPKTVKKAPMKKKAAKKKP